MKMRWSVYGVLGTCSILAALVVQPAQAADGKGYFKMDAGVALLQDVEINGIGGLDFPFNATLPRGSILGIDLPSSLVGTPVTLDKPKLTTEPGVRVDFIGGYNISETFALELEAGLLWNSFDEMTISGQAAGISLSESMSLSDLGVDMSLWQVPVFVNGVYTFNLHSKFKPFIGAGVGGVFTLLSMEGSGESDSESDFTFAYQGMAGVKYELSDTVDLGVTYKFMGTLDHDFNGVKTDPILSHSILAALTIRF